jgi:hypothetical protein
VRGLGNGERKEGKVVWGGGGVVGVGINGQVN